MFAEKKSVPHKVNSCFSHNIFFLDMRMKIKFEGDENNKYLKCFTTSISSFHQCHLTCDVLLCGDGSKIIILDLTVLIFNILR